MSEELKPCPFCGQEQQPLKVHPNLCIFLEARPHTHIRSVYCENCGSRGGKLTTEAEAIAAWNQREDER